VVKRVKRLGYFGIKEPAVSGILKVIEGRRDGEIKLRKEIEYHREN